MAPWLRDEDGNDVFDSVNSPLSGKPIFDKVDTENSLEEAFGEEAGNAGAVVDNVDAGLRGITNMPGMPGFTADAGLNVLQQTQEYQDGYNPDSPGTRGGDGNGDGGTPMFDMGKLKAIIGFIIAAVSLYLLAPVIELITEIIDED